MFKNNMSTRDTSIRVLLPITVLIVREIPLVRLTAQVPCSSHEGMLVHPHLVQRRFPILTFFDEKVASVVEPDLK